MNWTIPGSNPGRNKRFFSSPECPDQLWGQRSLLVKGYGDSFPGLFRPGREVDYGLLCRTKVKNEWRHGPRDSFSVTFAVV
jgi:hypothetical protein